MPDFLIIGAQRCGTSSLYRYLGAHPDISPSIRKETAYFSTRFDEGELWYRAHFPMRARMTLHESLTGQPTFSFEATPDYLFHPLTPPRVFQALPNANFIVLLRDPTERAFSHYKHMRRFRFEDLTFEEALQVEEKRISPDLEGISTDPSRPIQSALRFSYLARGRYAEQLRRWFDRFPRERFLILEARDLFDDPSATLRQICDFLGARPWEPRAFHNYSEDPVNPNPYRDAKLDESTRKLLNSYFTENDKELVRLTGQSFSWM